MRLNSLVFPEPSEVANAWPGRKVGAAEVLMQMSAKFASSNGFLFAFIVQSI